MLMHGTKYQQCSSFVLGLGVLKLFITLTSYDWLRVHSVRDSISMAHQLSSTHYCKNAPELPIVACRDNGSLGVNIEKSISDSEVCYLGRSQEFKSLRWFS
jgi:hypothetical protein